MCNLHKENPRHSFNITNDMGFCQMALKKFVKHFKSFFNISLISKNISDAKSLET